MHIEQAKKREPLFRVDFFGGLSVVTSAPNSLKAEQRARRKHPGIVRQVRILKGKAR